MDWSILFMPIITLATAQLTVLDLGKFRFSTKKLAIILILELIVQVTICAAIFQLFGYDAYVYSFFFCMEVPAVFTLLFVSKRRDFRDIFTALVTIFISFAFSIPSFWLAQLIGGKGNFNGYNLIRIVIFPILFFLLHRIVRARYIQIQDELDKGWGIFSILPLIACFVMYYQYVIYSRTGDFSDVVVNCILVILMLIAIFMVFNYVLTQLHEKYLLQEQRRILSLQNKAQLDQFEQQREAAEKSNRRWHDLRHGTQQLIDLLESNKYEEALNYLKEQRGETQIEKATYCMHPVVNSMLCLWGEKAKKVGIRIDINTDIPEQLMIEPLELSALFANAIENAYEACLRLPEDVPKFIKVQAQYNGSRLAIGITNSCLPHIPFEKDMPLSMKKGGGIGTRSITYTVERFAGTKYFEAKDGVFIARFVLNI
ncbi:MAG: hypothetical protein K0R34_2968 [Herbinix sp.]|jgi:hypothetical protein|nr:hypothetical protein [Herbinix sp.]